MLRVLVVEDERVAASAHAEYVRRVDGFELAAVAHTGQEALQVLGRQPVDLVLLDMNLPDVHGLDILRRMRAAGHTTDIIAVTSARDLEVVRQSVSLGVVQYLLKPFLFSTLRERLESYARYREELHADSVVATQQAVDRLLSQPRASLSTSSLPKGLSPESLDAVTRLLQAEPTPLSAAEVGERTASSRVTARRYLEYLCDVGLAVRRPRYSSTGRPTVEYVWKGSGPSSFR
jgi:response regulator of citrate/malate metabolism